MMGHLLVCLLACERGVVACLQPAPFVRWIPLNKKWEVLWRCMFATMGTYLMVIAQDPW
jgi:hypothetical protein